MQRKSKMHRALSLVLILTMLLSASPLAMASAPENDRTELAIEEVESVSAQTRMDTPTLESMEEQVYAATDSVRVSIVLEDAPTLELYSTTGVAENASAMAYREGLMAEQENVSANIEADVLDGEALDVVWNLTLAANIISANVEYGQIEDIAAIEGVAEVIIESSYDPMGTDGSADTFMTTSSGMIGAGTAWSSGYTGAGSRIAIIDTGLDTDHQSFDSGAFLYSLAQQAAKKEMDADKYIAGLDLLTAADIAEILPRLNIYPYVQYLSGTASGAYYVNEKVPFALSYVDRNYEITHDDGISEHGSHVAGIAAANSYIPDGNGGYENALDTVLTQGVAPDAQIIVMKVFSAAGGGAYDSDYMVAIEDAIMLGCDVVNLSLGGNKGFARSKLYQDILDNLEKSNTIVTIASGNSGNWATESSTGYLYSDDIDMSMMSSPAAATNSLAVASVENVGTTDYYISVDGQYIYYGLSVRDNAYTDGLNVLGGDYDYIYIDGMGTAAELEEVCALAGSDLSKTILVCSRGEINFSEKAQNAYNAGFAGLIVYNNADGSFNMNLDGYTGTIPCVSITKADGAALKAAAEAVANAEGETVYYKGSVYVSDKVMSNIINSGSYEMSSFSSWGVAGSLELKPEISAPGGSIYSVNGSVASGDAYELMSGTSMATPQVAGMAAVVMQYIRENELEAKTGMSARQLATSLLMSTAVPMGDDSNGGYYYPVLQQGAGIANLGNALQSSTYIKMDSGATSGAADGKVKAELGDDPDRSGVYSFGFTINNFSDSPKTYSLSSDFFTQGLFDYYGTGFLDTATVPLAASVSFTVDSQSLTVSSEFECDLNADSVTDDKDAQIIIEYAVGNDVSQYIDAINAKADLSEDGSIDTYDAHLLLASLRSGYFQVEAGRSVHVQVSVALGNKDYLDEAYVNGAYVQGYVYVSSAPSAEGEVDPDHSIPVLGFYGNWSDASMYDRADYEDYLYYYYGAESDFIYPYTGGLNYLSLFDESGIYESYFIGNPYLIEDSYPEGREAITSKTELGDFAVTLIRNAGGFLFYVKDETNDKIVHTGSSEQMNSAYYYENYGAWVYVNSVGLSIWETPKSFGLKEGDVFTIGFMAVPEYYETDGALSTEELVELMESGTIGEGAYHTRTFTIDDTDPVVNSVEKDENGNLVINAQDNQYIAAVAVLNAKGSNVLTMSGVEQDEANTAVETVIDMSEAAELIDGNCIVMVADYAGNETYYTVYGYNEGINDYAGRMYAFTDVSTRGTANSWMEVTVDNLYYDGSYGGTTDVANMNWSVRAAEYVNGYVFMVSDNKLYVAEQGDWENCSLVTTDSKYATIKDLAYDYSTGTLYALGGTATENIIYSINIADGTLNREYTVSLSFPRYVDTSVNCELLSMTIDDEGNFYAINCGNTSEKRVYLFKWSASDVADGAISDLAPVNNTENGYVGYEIYCESYDTVISDNVDYSGTPCTQSMAWDHDKDVLYWASSQSRVSLYNILYVIDTTDGYASKAVEKVSGQTASASSTFCGNVAGLYIVPESSGSSSAVEEATGIQLSDTELTLLEGAEYQLGCDVFPWNLMDKSVTWTSSNEEAAIVDKDGLVTAVKEGTAVITATTNAAPYLSASCTVTVEAIKGTDLSAMLYNADAEVNFVKFNTLDSENWTVLTNGDKADYNFISGTVLAENDTLYMHDGSHMYGVDANTFEVTDYGIIDATWQWSDAAPAPTNSTDYFGRIVGIINSGCALGVMNVESGMGYEITHYSLFKKDPMALIAYKGACSHTDEYGTYDAHEYYVLTESGELYSVVIWAFYDEDAMVVHYTDEVSHVGSTGLRLTGISDVSYGRYGSMYYDAENDYLIVSAYTRGTYNELYVFDPDVCAPAKLGTFGNDIWPVTSLYDYEQFTELTVKVRPIKAEMYVGESVQLSSKVYVYENSSAVTWKSMDESIATVDENGLVTGVGAGTVEIRAYSVESDTVYGSATVTVKPLSSIDVELHAYITTSEGGKWVSIDGKDLSYEVLASSSAVYTGAGVADGKVYATDKSYYYEIDPSNGYSVTKGDKFTDGNGAACMNMLDATAAPVGTAEVTDFSTGETITVAVGGEPVYMSAYDGEGYHYLTILHDYQSGNFSAAAIEYTYNPAAVAYHSSRVISGYYFDFYYILGYDGIVETYSLYSGYSGGERYISGGWEDDYFDTGLEFEDGDDVSMVYVNNAAFTGLIISHATASGTDVYCYDTVNMKLGKLGRISEASDLVGLSLMTDISGETEYYKDVTFRVVNGTWADGTTADKTVKVELKDENGNWSETGTGTVEIPTGMIASEGYEGGAWDVEPSTTVTGTEAVTYTYTFTEKTEGAGEDSVVAYIGDSNDNYYWVEISLEDLSLETLGTGSNSYNGAGFSNGKFYASTGSSFGSKTWYEIDPKDSFAVSGGYTKGVKMVDGAGAPAKTVTLSGVEVEVGGYMVYVDPPQFGSGCNAYMLTDVTSSSGYEQLYPSTSFPGKPIGVAYRSGSVSDDGSKYNENFVVLCNNGALVEMTVTTSIENGAKAVSSDVTTNTLATISIDGLSGYSVTSSSMTMISEDVFVIAATISGNVQLYRYDLTANELSSLGTVNDYSYIVGVTPASEVTGESGGDDSGSEEPSESSNVLGYLAVEDGYVWADIDPATGDYTELATDTVEYVSAAVWNDKIVAVSGVSKYGNTTYNFYEVDPANDYAATKSICTVPNNSGTVADATFAPVVTAALLNEEIEDYEEVGVGGYYVYIANGKYESSTPKVYAATDYSGDVEDYYTEFSASFSGKLAAIAYLNGRVSGDELSYLENFLILGQDGTLYNFQLVTDSNGLNGAANVTSAATLDLSAASGASMVRVDDDTVVISVNADDGVVLYSYVVSTGTLTRLSVIEEAVTLAGLTLMKDVPAGSGSEPTPDPEPVVETKTVTFRVVNGTWADGTTADIVETVELTDGTGTVTVPTGMIASEGYEGGAWDVIPTGTVSGTEPVTYTYSFTEKQAEEEPSDGYVLIGYLTKSQKEHAWASLDTSDMSYELLTDWTNSSFARLSGALVSDGKLYATRTSTSSSNSYYYMYDPDNSYVSKKGSEKTTNKMEDGTSAPVKSADIVDAVTGATVTTAVGVPLYVRNDKDSGTNYVTFLEDYSTATDVSETLSKSDSKVLAVSYVSAALSEDGKTYSENYVILFQDGMLYDYTVKYTVSDGTVSRAGTLSSNCVDTGLASKITFADTGTGGGSMALVEENILILSVFSSNTTGTVQLYKYDLTDKTLTLMGEVEGMITMVGLSLLSDVTDADATAAASGSAAKTGFDNIFVDRASASQRGAGDSSISGQSMSQPVSGSLMSASSGSTESSLITEGDVTVDTSKQTVTVEITEDIDVTNGVVVVSYDPEVLTFTGASSMLYYAVNSSESGKVVLGYASASAVSAGNLIGSLKFSYVDSGKDVTTDITVTTTERNDEDMGDGSSETTTVTIPTEEDNSLDVIVRPGQCEHEYVDEVIRPATDTQDGEVRHTCTKCGHTYTETVPASCASSQFSDLDLNAWYHESTDYVISNGLMNGVGESLFNPNGTLTRAMLVTVLYRIAGEPETDNDAGFEDVADGMWYTDAINWAEAEGVVTGYDAERFGPYDAVTREQMAAMLWRFAKSTGIDTSDAEKTDISAYSDAEKVSTYAVSAMKWACGEGIIKGITTTTLVPQGDATRAQVAAVLHRFCENVLG